MKQKFIISKIIFRTIINILVFATILFIATKYQYITNKTALIISIGLALWLMALSVLKYRQFHRYRPRIFADYIELNRGVIFHSSRYLPIENIQSFIHKRTLLERIFKLNTIIFNTAGIDITLSFLLDEEVSEFIERHIMDGGGQDEA